MTPKTPNGWRQVELSELLSESEDRVGDRSDLPLLSITKYDGAVLAKDRFSRVLASKDLSRYRVAPRDSVVIDPMLLWDGVIALQHRFTAGVVSPDYRVFRFTPEADPGFFDYLAHSTEMRRQYARAARGTNVRRRRISRDDFLAIRAVIPALEEQRRIAKTLKAVDDAILMSQQVVQQGALLKKAVLDGWCSEERSASEGWELRTLDEFVAPDRPICYGILMPGHGHPGGVPVIKVRNMKNGVIEEADLLLTSPEIDQQYARSRLRAGDLLLSIRGTTGRVARVPPSLDRANITQDSARLSIRQEFDAKFVYQCLQSSWLQRQIREHTRGQAVKGINIGDVRRLVLPVPPYAQQCSLAEAMEVLDRRVGAEQAFLDQLRVVKLSVQSRLLSGELRCGASNCG